MTTEPKRYTTENPLKILSLGWGVQSWTLAAMAALGEIEPVDYAIHADTTHEAEGTYAHATKWTPWLERRGVKVVTVKAGNTDAVRDNVGTNGSILVPAFTLDESEGEGQIRRQCTQDWKIIPIRRFLRTHSKATPGAITMLLGISLDEWHRMKDSNVKYIKHIYPLVDMRISRADCVAWLESHNLDLPPKSACTFCPYHSLTSWKNLKRQGGVDWDRAVTVDAAVREKRPNLQTFLHPRRKPLEEAVRIPEDFGATQMEMDIPCDSGHCFV